MWKCPKCGENMHDTDDQCWSCKTMNPSIPKEQGGAGEPAQTGQKIGLHNVALKKKCPFCAEEVLIDAIKCRFCGSVLPKHTSENAYIRVPKWVVLAFEIIAFSGLFLALAAGGIYLYRATTADKNMDTKAPSAPKNTAAKKGAYEEIIDYEASGKNKKAEKNYTKKRKQK